MEAPPGFEPGVEVLQTSALPLGDGADRTKKQRRVRQDPPSCADATACLTPEESGSPSRSSLACQASEGWSGKRDSNPRLRPWQGRTLPLSYSRPDPQPNTRPGWLSRFTFPRA